MNDSVNVDEASDNASDAIRNAQSLLKQDRTKGLAALNDAFRAGIPPDPPLDGPYHGELLALDIAPLVTQSLELLTSLWMPWKGKYFTANENKGDNLFGQKSRTALRIIYPFYGGIAENNAETFRAFVFKTSVADGMVDADRKVLKIDYHLPDNPALTIRRIVDELVQVADGVYLGKIHLKWWWGKWQMIGYFSLRVKKS